MEFNGVSKLFPLEKNTRSTWKRKMFQLIILICYLLKRWEGFSDCKIPWKLQRHIRTGYDIVLVFIDELITFIWAYGDKCCVVNNAILANVLKLSHEQTNSVISEWAHNSRQKQRKEVKLLNLFIPMNLILWPKNCIDRRLQIFLSWIMQWKELNTILLFSVLIFPLIKTIPKSSNAIGYHQPRLSSNSTVYASCL